MIAVPTDLDLHAFWPTVPRLTYCVGTEDARTTLLARGQSEDTVHVTGIPLGDSSSGDCPDEDPIPAGSGPVVLVLAGGLGPHPYAIVSGALPALLDAMDSSDARLVIVCGGARHAVEARIGSRAAGMANVSLTGYIRDIRCLMERCDLAVCKPGGLTCTELLASSLPAVLLTPAWGQERANLSVMLRAETAVAARPADAGGAVEGLLGDEGRLRSMRDRSARLGRPDAALAIARHVLSAG